MIYDKYTGKIPVRNVDCRSSASGFMKPDSPANNAGPADSGPNS
jgi:hypothetical protein